MISTLARNVRRSDVVGDHVIEWAAWCYVEQTVTWWIDERGALTTVTMPWTVVVDVSGAGMPHHHRAEMAAVGRTWLSSERHGHADNNLTRTTADPAC